MDEIISQRGSFWVMRNKDKTYNVLVDGTCAAVVFETYNDESLALARMNYLARTVIDTVKFYDKVSIGAI